MDRSLQTLRPLVPGLVLLLLACSTPGAGKTRMPGGLLVSDLDEAARVQYGEDLYEARPLEDPAVRKALPGCSLLELDVVNPWASIAGRPMLAHVAASCDGQTLFLETDRQVVELIRERVPEEGRTARPLDLARLFARLRRYPIVSSSADVQAGMIRAYGHGTPSPDEGGLSAPTVTDTRASFFALTDPIIGDVERYVLDAATLELESTRFSSRGGGYD